VGDVATGNASRTALLKPLRSGEPVPSTLTEKGALYFVNLTPVKAGRRTVGYLLLGSKLGDELAADLRNMTRADVTFRAAGICAGTTLEDPGEREALAAALSEAPETGSDMTAPEAGADVVAPGLFRIHHAGTTTMALASPLPGSTGEHPDRVILQRNLDRESAYLRDIQRGLTQLGLVVLAITLVVGLSVGQRITTPILHLVRAAEGIEQGNYEVPLPAEGGDEVGYLARRFDAMRRHERVYVNNLREVAQIKGKFIDVASHEIRTPTAVIKGYAELLSRGSMGPVNDKQRHALEAIESSLETIDRITENATWMAQLEGDRPRLDRTPCPMADLLEHAVRATAAEAVGRQVEVTVDLEDDDLTAEVDGPRLTQAIVQLLRNGVRFTPDGGAVTVRARSDDGDLLLEVEDDGVGIPETNPAQLFERSVLVRDVLRHHSSTGLEFNSAGLGLGLPIARGIVDAHAGSIEAARRSGGGSVFTIRIFGAVARRDRRAA
jgi:signal transduction histidine kinase